MEIGLKTGVVGFLKGGRPGKTVAIREDIDALPMSEKTGLPYASSVDGVCHSCGHDIHTTVLLFCARILSELRNQLSGKCTVPIPAGGGARHWGQAASGL